jgi:hypothetical protein
MKKLKIAGIIITVLAVLCYITNPTLEDYVAFSEEKFGPVPKDLPFEVENERINFYLFSTYAPKIPMDHYGIVHLGMMGMFIPISEGQYDYPWWLEYFN